VGLLSIIISVLLILVCWGTAIADFVRAPQVVETMERLGVSLRLMPFLGVLKGVGGIGLILGQWNEPLLVVTAICLALYFAIATVIHIRVKDAVSGTAPAVGLLVLSTVLAIAVI
jgi:hypothetical protein